MISCGERCSAADSNDLLRTAGRAVQASWVTIEHATASTFVFRKAGLELSTGGAGPRHGAGPDSTRAGGWQIALILHPGHGKPGETPARAALREVAEETGLAARLLARPASLPGADAWQAGTVRDAAAVPGAEAEPGPWWIAEYRGVPPDNHLAEPHVHVDHLYVAVARSRHTGAAGHPLSWHGAADLGGLDMYESTRRLALWLLDGGLAGPALPCG